MIRISLRSRYRLLISLLAALALYVGLAVPLASAAQADDGQPVRRPVSATFVGVNSSQGDNCGWFVGIQVPKVAGAVSYDVEYWDGYWQRVEHRNVPMDQADDNDQWGGGQHIIGVTGGWYSPPCSADPVPVGDRFNQGAKAWAVFPPNYKPKPSIKVKVTLPEGGASVGQKVEAKVELTAGDVALTSVSLGSGLTPDGPGARVTKRPGGLNGFKMAAGSSKTFHFTVTAKEPGATALRASATATSKKGPARGSGAASLRVARDALALTVGTEPNKVELEVDDEGKVKPQDVLVTIKATNTGQSVLQNVSIQSLRPEPIVKGQRLDQLGLPSGTLPITLGDIAPKSTATRTFPLTVTGDGRYQIRAMALFANPAGLNATEVAIGGKFEAVVPPLFFTSKLEDGTSSDADGAWVKAGEGFHISGSVSNLSDYKHLCMYPLIVDRKGNADFLGPIDTLTYADRSIAPPLAGGLKPGESIPFGLWAQTEQLGGTRAELRFAPKAVLVDPGDSCDVARVTKLKPLPPEQVKTAPDSTEYVVRVDTRDAQFPPLPPQGKLFNFAGGFLVGMGVTTGKALQGTFATAAELVRAGATPENYFKAVMLPYQANAAATQALQNMSAATATLAYWWANATPYERRAFMNSVEARLVKSHDDAWASAAKMSDALVADLMGDITAYYANDNDPAVWRALGRRSGGITSQVVIEIAMNEASVRVGAKFAQLQAEFRQVAGESRTYTKLRGLPAGKMLNPTELRKLWGMTVADIRNYNRIAREHNVLIAMRGRAPISVRQLQRGSVWKHEAIKAKNVNRIDIEFLNFDKADDGLVAMKKYSDAEKAAIQQKIAQAGLTPEQLEEVTLRMKKRFGEADKYLADMQRLNRNGRVDVGFNYADNGLPDVPTQSKFRDFQLMSETNEAGTITFKPMQSNPDLKQGLFGKLPPNCKQRIVNAVKKVLCRVTGDMDGVYLTTPQGGPIPKDKLLAVYRDLEEAGWQHPETLTWAEDMGNRFWFDDKADILKNHQLGGEALAEFSPDGIRATYLSVKRSRLIDGATGDWWAAIVGGFKAVR